MKKIIHETMILGPTSVYAEYTGADHLLIEAHENYQKRSYRNRYLISGPNGVIQLSVPLVKGKNYRTPIKDVKISYDMRWEHQHINTIKSCYGSSPYFIHYEDELGEVFKKKFTFLLDLNLSMMELIFRLAGILLDIEYTESYHTEYIVGDLRNAYGIKNHYPTSVKYPQVFEEKFGFIEGLSILDLLFCTGPESKLYLTRMKAAQ